MMPPDLCPAVSFLAELFHHKHTVRIFPVGPKRSTEFESETGVQLSCRFKVFHRTGFEAETSITPLLGFLDQVAKYL